MQLFEKGPGQTPFYAGFGNRFTDALSYRSVNIPSTRIFTINSNAEVSLDVLSLNSYKTGYASMREIVDHFFPPVGLLVPAGGEDFTDFNYWRDRPLDIEDFTDSEDDDDGESTEAASVRSEDEGSDVGEDLAASYMTQDSLDETGLQDSIIESVEGGDEYIEGAEYVEGGEYLDDGEEYVDEEDDQDDVEVDTTLLDTPLREDMPLRESPPEELTGGIAERMAERRLERMSQLNLRDASATPRVSPGQ
jgi:phosphatidate phosphatase LPIN